MAQVKSKSKKPIIRKVPKDCTFCKSKSHPTYKESDTLYGYITERAKIIGKDRSGICSKHQRHLTREIKRARQLGLLPFSSSF